MNHRLTFSVLTILPLEHLFSHWAFFLTIHSKESFRFIDFFWKIRMVCSFISQWTQKSACKTPPGCSRVKGTSIWTEGSSIFDFQRCPVHTFYWNVFFYLYAWYAIKIFFLNFNLQGKTEKRNGIIIIFSTILQKNNLKCSSVAVFHFLAWKVESSHWSWLKITAKV